MEMRERQGDRGKQERFGGEKMILMIYTVYSIAFYILSIDRYDIAWVDFLLVAALVSAWYLYVMRKKTHYFRAMYTVLMMQISICLYGSLVEDLYHMLPIVVTFTVTAGLYGIEDVIKWFSLSNFLLFFIHYAVLGNMPVGEELGISLLQFVNVECAVAVVFFWVKKRNENAKRMQRIMREQKEIERSKDDFLANVSHEIRTPINTICGISDILLQQVTDQQEREQIFYIQTAGKNLVSVVSDILDFSELQNGNVELEKEEYNITSTINDVINMTQAKINDKPIELLVDCDANLPCGLLGDEKKIRRVVMNLVDNAVKFTDQGCVSIRVGFRKEKYGINLIITVRDTGMGIESEKVENLFGSFNQADGGRNRKNSGVGLGLAISRILIRKMGGVISMKSKLGVGTSVKLVIPQKVINEGTIVHLEHAEQYRIGIYIDMEQMMMPEIRDAYSENIARTIAQTQADSYMFQNLSELKRRLSKEQFTHILIGIQEYREDSAYFDQLSEERSVIVVLNKKEEKELTNPHLLHCISPIYVVPIVTLLKNSTKKNGQQVQRSAKLPAVKDVRILIVDDNHMNLKVAEGFLQKYEIQVTTALSGKEALQLVEENRYDLIFMDHMMPEMDGVTTMHRIRAKSGIYFRTVPIVALTANAIAGAREMFLKEGFNDFLEKPMERSVLERVLLRNLPKEKLRLGEAEAEELTETSEQEASETETTEPLEREPKGIQISEQPEQEAKETEVSGQPGQEVKGTKGAEQPEQESTGTKVSEQPEQNEEEQQTGKDVEVMEEYTAQQGLQIGDLDMKTGVMYCGSEENLIEILKICGETAEENKTKLQQFYEDKNWKEYTILIHGVKSSMRSVGAMKLSDMAKELEQAGKNNDEAFIDAHHEEMMKEYNRVDAFLHACPLLFEQTKPAVEEKPAQSLQPIEERELEEKIHQVEEAMYDFDGDKMESILRELQQYSYGGISLEKPLTAIIRKVEMTDYMSAYDTLVKVKGEMKKKKEKMESR